MFCPFRTKSEGESKTEEGQGSGEGAGEEGKSADESKPAEGGKVVIDIDEEKEVASMAEARGKQCQGS